MLKRAFKYPLKLSIIFTIFFNIFAANAQSDDTGDYFEFPQLPIKSEKLQDFIPNSWIVEYLQQDDLNNDGVLDTVLVLRSIGQASDGKMSGRFEVANPRMLIVLFKQGKFWRLVKQDTDFIPQSVIINDEVVDPFHGIVYGGVTAKNGTLNIRIGFFGSQMGFYVYRFRWQNGDFNLVGYDYSSTQRTTGTTTEESYNFITNKKKTTIETLIIDPILDEATDKVTTKIKWTKLKPHELLSMDDINEDFSEYLKDIDT
ncbi:hypothetical protein [Bartonella sp. HY038]|uniref:hypothetical protein n=1 Tax=Bartonella sp. HY038 TaxID=2759660 RepID=UPI0015FDE3DD|nr:hypothetical protein [Bartonella sp. HY038]